MASIKFLCVIDTMTMDQVICALERSQLPKHMSLMHNLISNMHKTSQYALNDKSLTCVRTWQAILYQLHQDGVETQLDFYKRYPCSPDHLVGESNTLVESRELLKYMLEIARKNA